MTLLDIGIGTLLALAVAAAWLGGLGALRLPRALDRLHAVTFVGVAAGLPVAAAALLADGVSSRSLKVLLLVGLQILWGAVLSHASGRALLLREGPSA
ncbi:monovalent cation/H(+) antiporter subunit G [Methylobacterium sp. JK268]